jgi:ankyrin repeat protein
MAAEEAIETIHRAAREGNAMSVARMLDEDPGLLSSVWNRDTLLTTAVWNDNLDVVRLLLERGAEIDKENEYGGTALNYAVRSGHEEMVSMLLNSGADISRRGCWRQTVLMHASEYGHVVVVRLLLGSKGGRDLLGHVLDERTEGGRTALWCACLEGHADVVRALLLAGADHTIADNDDTTPLQIAEGEEYYDCVAMIQVSTSLVSR